MSSLQEKTLASSSSLSPNLDGAPIGLEKGEAKKSRNSNKEQISQESDSFNKHYNKEIKVNQEEIPIVLYELLDAAYNYIQRESYEKAIILLQKTEGVLDVVKLDQSKRDRYIIFCTFQNMALCYQKLGMLEECYVYLKECQKMISVPQFYKENTVTSRMRQLKQECKIKLQLCAILSQTQNHTEALDNSKKSVKLVHQLFKDLLVLCGVYIKKIESRDPKFIKMASILATANKNGDELQHSERQQISILSTSPSQFQIGNQKIQNSGNFLEDSISMLERTSLKLYPIVKEVVTRMIEELPFINPAHEKQLASEIEFEKILLPEDADMRSVLGFLNQNEWIYNLNIGNIMQIQPVSMKDLLSTARNETELSRDSFLEKLSLLSVAYFCVSTEMRFILQSRVEFLTSPVKKKKELESEFWHAKALEIACTFLPSECPLLNHILLSYQKHHDPSQQPIREDQESNDLLDVIRPLKGIESNKYQPIIRQIQNLKVAISPCQLSPLTRRIFKSHPAQTTDKKSLPHSTTNQQVQTKSTGDQIDIQGLINAAAISEIKEDDQQNFKDISPPSILADNTEIKRERSQGEESKQSRDSWKHLQINLYSEEYYDIMVKKIIDDPKLDKKQLVQKLISKIKSEDYSSLAHLLREGEYIEDASREIHREDENLGSGDDMIRKSFEAVHTLQSHKVIENPDESSLHQIWTDHQIQRKSVQSIKGGIKAQSLSKENKLKKRKDPKIQKMMSYLEGDSLLKEIEKSLEHDNEIEYQDDDEDEDEEDEFYDFGEEEEEDQFSQSEHNNDVNKSQITDNISTDALKQIEKLSTGVNPKHISSNDSKGNKSSNFKSKSFSRPSSSFTNQTTASQIKKAKRFTHQKKLQSLNNGQPQQFLRDSNPNARRFATNYTQKSHETLKVSNSKNNHHKHSTTNPRNMSSSDRSKSSEKLFSHPLINNFLTNDQPDKHLQAKSIGKQEQIKKNAKFIKSKLIQTTKQRSASRYSNPGKYNSKVPPSQEMNENKNKRLSILFNSKEKLNNKQKRGQESRSSSNENKTRPQSEGRRKVSKSREKSNDISFFKQLAKEPPLLTQPSENLTHNYSFDIAMPSSQKNISTTGDNKQASQLISELQKKVLQNQKMLMMFKKINNSDTKKSSQKKGKSFGNLKQSEMMAQSSQLQNPNNQSVIVESINAQSNNHFNNKNQSSQKRSKSNNFISGGGKRGNSSNLLTKQNHLQSVDASTHLNQQNSNNILLHQQKQLRQSAVMSHNSNSLFQNKQKSNLNQLKHQMIESLLSNNKELLKQNIVKQHQQQQLQISHGNNHNQTAGGNKENINNTSILLDSTKMILQKSGLTKKSKKKSNIMGVGNSITSGVNQSFIAEKNKLAKDLEQLKNRMKEHFRFFDNHSPQLKKKKQGGSHSPPKKHTQSTSHNRSIRIENTKNSRKLSKTNQQQQIFATTDNRRPFSKKRISNIGAGSGHGNNGVGLESQNEQHNMTTFQQYFTTQNDMSVNGGGAGGGLNDDSLWLPHEQSFDNFIQSTITGGANQNKVGQKVHNVSNIHNMTEEGSVIKQQKGGNSNILGNLNAIVKNGKLNQSSIISSGVPDKSWEGNQNINQNQEKNNSNRLIDNSDQNFEGLFGSGIHRGSTDVMILNSGDLQKASNSHLRKDQIHMPKQQLVGSEISKFSSNNNYSSMINNSAMPFEIASSSAGLSNQKIVPLRNRNTSKILKTTQQQNQRQPSKSSSSLAPNRSSFDQLSRKLLHNLRA